MSRDSRGGTWPLALASGVGAGWWVQVALRWAQLAPRGASESSLLAALLAGTWVGGWMAARWGDEDAPLATFARGQLLLAAACASASAVLAATGWTSPLAIGAVGATLGAVAHGARSTPAALLLGGAIGWALGGGGALGGASLLHQSIAAAGGQAAIGGVALLRARGRATEPASPAARGAAWSVGAGFVLALFVAVAARGLAPYTGNTAHGAAILGTTTLAGCAVGARLARRRSPSATLLGLALLTAVATFACQGELEWILPGLARRLGGLASFPRTLALTTFVTGLVLLPTTILLLAGVGTRALRQLPRVAIGAAAVAVAGPLVAGADRLAFGDAPFEQRYGALLYLREQGLRTMLVTDDPEQGRILRRVDGASPGGVGTDPEDRVNAQIPMLLHPSVDRVLQLGFGVGNGASSILAYPIARLDVVDREGTAADIAPFFDATNLDVLSDRRLVLHQADPWSFLASTDQRWDVIRLAGSDFEGRTGDDLPTIERLELARDRLSSGGVLSLRVNVGRLSNHDLRTVVATMAAVFPSLTIWDGPLGYNWVINGSTDPRPPSLARLARWRDDPDVDAELGSLGLDEAATFLGHLVMGDEQARSFSRGAAVATSARPLLDASSATSPLTYYGMGATAADTALGDLTAADRRENVGVARLFQRLTEIRALKEAASGPHAEDP